MLRSVSWALFIAILLFGMLIGMQSGKAYARANLMNYIAIQPNSWEMSGYNILGTAANNTVIMLGWNATKIMGNVGMGDGSLSVLKQSSNKLVNYSENNYMAGDVSEAPWDPGRIYDPEISASASDEDTGTKSIDSKATNADTKASGSDEKEAETDHDTDQETSGSYSDNSTMIRDGYHPIYLGRPVDDLLYEHPLVISGTTYLRLVGLRMPGGGCLNVGMRTLSYGY